MKKVIFILLAVLTYAILFLAFVNDDEPNYFWYILTAVLYGYLVKNVFLKEEKNDEKYY